jgi:serine/threonine-protein kinase HipA
MAGLNAWMNGEWVGTWHVHRGTHSFTYTPTWLTSEKSRPLSLSLPLTRTLEIKGDVVANYFDNLLPDNDRIRERIGRRFKPCNCCPRKPNRMDGIASSVSR